MKVLSISFGKTLIVKLSAVWLGNTQMWRILMFKKLLSSGQMHGRTAGMVWEVDVCKRRQNWPAFLSWQAEGDSACLCLPLSLSIDKGKELFKL